MESGQCHPASHSMEDSPIDDGHGSDPIPPPMKLGVSYNVFDGHELLRGSIECIRGSVDYLTVVWQRTSNYGRPCHATLEPLLALLVDEQLIDQLVLYEPNLALAPHENETRKRNIGLDLSRQQDCTHHMSMDTDEYYLREEFDNLKSTVIEGQYDSSYCFMEYYWKTWHYAFEPKRTLGVACIYRIRQGVQYGPSSGHPCSSDPTRSMAPGHFILLPRNSLQMHHGSFVRHELGGKLANTSSHQLRNAEHQIRPRWEQWKYPERILFMNNIHLTEASVRFVDEPHHRKWNAIMMPYSAYMDPSSSSPHSPPSLDLLSQTDANPADPIPSSNIDCGRDTTSTSATHVETLTLAPIVLVENDLAEGILSSATAPSDSCSKMPDNDLTRIIH